MSTSEAGSSAVVVDASDAAPAPAADAPRRRETLGEKAERLAGSNQAMGLLAIVSIAESAILPLPVDAVALPMMAANRKKIPLVVLVGRKKSSPPCARRSRSTGSMARGSSSSAP
jgi:hypothetical protein